MVNINTVLLWGSCEQNHSNKSIPTNLEKEICQKIIITNIHAFTAHV